MKILAIVILLFIFPVTSHAIISFSNGKWESTFDCEEYTLFTGTLVCDGLSQSGEWSTDGHQTAITEEANNPTGAGGNGARFWKGSGDDNRNSGTIAVYFPSGQREIWVRWYERYESGFEWNGDTSPAINVKSLYFKSTDSNPYCGFYGDDQYTVYHNNIVGGHKIGNGGWATVYPTGTSDGTWFCYEIHLKMDTDGTDGVVQTWVNGINIVDNQAVDFGAGGSSHGGWTYFEFLSNQKDPALARAYYVDFDDMVIYNTTPPSMDGSGRPFIGPMDAPPSTVHGGRLSGSLSGGGVMR